MEICPTGITWPGTTSEPPSVKAPALGSVAIRIDCNVSPRSESENAKSAAVNGSGVSSLVDTVLFAVDGTASSLTIAVVTFMFVTSIDAAAPETTEAFESTIW